MIDRLSQLDESLVELEIRKSVLTEIKNQIDQEGEEIDVYKLLPILMGSNYDGSLRTLIDGLNGLLLDKQKMGFSNKPNGDRMKEKDYQIDIQKNLIINSINSILLKLSLIHI